MAQAFSSDDVRPLTGPLLVLAAMVLALANFGAVRVFTIAVLSFGACSALCGLAPSFGLLVVCRVLQGLSGGPMMPLSQTLMLRIFPPERRGQAMGLWYGSLSLGNLVASLFAGEFDTSNLAAMPGQYLHISFIQAVAAAVLVVLLWLWRRGAKT